MVYKLIGGIPAYLSSTMHDSEHACQKKISTALVHLHNEISHLCLTVRQQDSAHGLQHYFGTKLFTS